MACCRIKEATISSSSSSKQKKDVSFTLDMENDSKKASINNIFFWRGAHGVWRNQLAHSLLVSP